MVVSSGFGSIVEGGVLDFFLLAFQSVPRPRPLFVFRPVQVRWPRICVGNSLRWLLLAVAAWPCMSAWLQAGWWGIAEVACIYIRGRADAAVGLRHGWAATSWAAQLHFCLLASCAVPCHPFCHASALSLAPPPGSLVPYLFLVHRLLWAAAAGVAVVLA